MKKVLAICLIMVMVMGMTVNVFAASNGFVSSPSVKPGPEIESFKPADEDCEGKLIITPYSEKEEISDVLEALLDKARNQISSTKNLTELNKEFENLVKSMNIDGKNLAVSDLFDIHVSDCDFHDGHKEFHIVLSADSLAHFVGLLHMKKDGTWELVKDAKVTNNGEHLKFSVESFSPFAIVVDTSSDKVDPPKTGDDSKVYIYFAIMAISALSLVFVFKKLKKRTV